MLLRIVAIRHAKPLNEGFVDEKERPLSQEGITIQNKMCLHLKELAIIPDIIYSSPVLRAQETAKIISRNFDNLRVDTLDALGYAFSESEILKNLPGPEENKTVFLVGHAPYLAELMNKLIGKVVLRAGLAKSGAVVVDFREPPNYGKGVFFGYYNPGSLYN